LNLIYIVMGVVVAFVVIEVALAFLAASKLAKPPRRRGSWTPRDLGFEYEDVTLRTRDGVELRGWFIRGSKPSTVIVLHGYTSSRFDESYIKPTVSLLAKEGFNVLVYDQRAHGESGGVYTTLGYREVEDLNDVVEWLRRSKPEASKSVGVIGFSMGGAVALMHAAKYGTLNAYIADSPYIDVFASGKRWIKLSPEPLRTMLLVVYPLITKLVESKMGVPGKELVLYRYAPQLRGRRVMIVAGRRDELVDVGEITKFVEEARRAGAEVELWVVDSRHVSAVKDYPEEYRERVVGFFEKWLT